jgi:hypothetical protein
MLLLNIVVLPENTPNVEFGREPHQLPHAFTLCSLPKKKKASTKLTFLRQLILPSVSL